MACHGVCARFVPGGRGQHPRRDARADRRGARRRTCGRANGDPRHRTHPPRPQAFERLAGPRRPPCHRFRHRPSRGRRPDDADRRCGGFSRLSAARAGSGTRGGAPGRRVLARRRPRLRRHRPQHLRRAGGGGDALSGGARRARSGGRTGAVGRPDRGLPDEGSGTAAHPGAATGIPGTRRCGDGLHRLAAGGGGVDHRHTRLADPGSGDPGERHSGRNGVPRRFRSAARHGHRSAGRDVHTSRCYPVAPSLPRDRRWRRGRGRRRDRRGLDAGEGRHR